MAKVPVPIGEIMSDPDLSLSSSPFSPGNMIIKRASFRAGETPDHLQQYTLNSGTCQGETGTVVYNGKEVPATAACVARQQG
jgi:hypothetical protein